MNEQVHHFPEGDFFEHEESPECACKPTYATVCVMNRGYVMRWHHKYVQFAPTPDVVPEWLETSSD